MTEQKKFIEFLLKEEVLEFGHFTLKSGRESPYFFNLGRVADGLSLAALGEAYAEAIMAAGLEFDVLFGPAYKGIPIASATAVALFDHFQTDTPYCFNRKEKKDHGEGGNLVGSALEGRVMLVDDVITAGTAIRESMDIVEQNGAQLAGVLIALDRQEKGKGELSAIQEVERDFNAQVIAIVSLNDVIEYLKDDEQFKAHLPAVEAYRAQYGVA